MALFRKLFYRKPPDGLLEICERVYAWGSLRVHGIDLPWTKIVWLPQGILRGSPEKKWGLCSPSTVELGAKYYFNSALGKIFMASSEIFDCCFATDAWEEQDYKVYVGGTIGQLRDHYPDASILVFNFREGETPSQIANALSEYDMTIMDYPRHYEGCPLLSMEVIHHFLRSSESWLSLGQQNVLLMHCERGGWPVLAFMLAALLIYRKQYTGEQKTLDMIYKQAPCELLHLLSPLNPIPSQLRYLQYVSRRNVASEWPPLDRALTLDCVIIRMIPNFDGCGGCRPIFRVYGQDPFLVADRTPKVLFSTPKRSKTVRHHKQAECELVKIDITCHIQGDVVLECISLHEDMEREEMMFRVMFNTAFIRSNILMLNRDEIDILWDAKDQFPKDFRAEVLFSEMDTAASIVPVDMSCFEEKEGLPLEAFARVQEIFSSVDWLVPNADTAVNVLQQITVTNIVQEQLDSCFQQNTETSTSLHELTPDNDQVKQKGLTALENSTMASICLDLEKQPVSSSQLSPNADGNELKSEFQSTEPRSQELQPVTPPPPHHPSRNSFTASTALSVTASPPLLPENLSTPEITNPSLTEPRVTHSHGIGQSSVVPPPPASETPFSGSIQKDISSNSPPSVGDPAISPSYMPLQILPSEESPATETRPPPPLPPLPPSLPSIAPTTDVGQVSSSSHLSKLQPPLTPVLKDHTSIMVKTSPPPPPPPPPLPQNPSTPPLKDNMVSQNRHHLPAPPPPPMPPTPPLKNEGVRTGFHSSSPPPPPPTSPLRENLAVRTGKPPSPPPPPPPPPPSTPPLKESSPFKARPPPPPPPPVHSSQAARTKTSSNVPPPPPPPASSSSLEHVQPASRKFSNVPSAPPPPVPSIKGESKMAPVPPQSPSPPPPFLPPSGTKGRSLSRAITSRDHQTKKLKPLHWLKLTRAVSGSLWAEAQKSGEASKAPEIDISELESLFSTAVPTDQGGSGMKSNSRASLGQKPEKVQLIEHRRAYNCEIMLSKVKTPLHDLMSSVLALEDTALDVDQVDNLIKFCPTKEEMELLKKKLARSWVVIRYKLTISYIYRLLMMISPDQEFCQIEESHANNSLAWKCFEPGNCKGASFCNAFVLGSAIGFRLDSLLKLTETRARNNKMTLMHYLCKVLADKLPELLDFSKDLSSLEPASKIQLKFLAEEMQAISKGLEKVVQELSMSENDGPVSENFRKSLKEFLCYAEGEVRSLASLYSAVGRNVDALILYFGEDPSPVSTLLNFVRMFNRAHEENSKQLELERKKAEKEASNEKLKLNASQKGPDAYITSPVRTVELMVKMVRSLYHPIKTKANVWKNAWPPVLEAKSKVDTLAVSF
ncbi:hypothetical protein RJ640_012604 [Escallonia rubra]|uniref:Formin-like protein n=1 Tax=Escallonia rubra TaxID=112253 RepID=A0AA88U6Z6_9ASTE|nr:hypothetical protein RJ640_012604 [Escallonia rubra]